MKESHMYTGIYIDIITFHMIFIKNVKFVHVSYDFKEFIMRMDFVHGIAKAKHPMKRCIIVIFHST